MKKMLLEGIFKMKLLRKFTQDFTEVSWYRKAVFIFIVAGILLNYSDMKDLYFNQTNACSVIGAFVQLPLPDQNDIQIKTNDNSKIKYFNIVCKIRDKQSIQEEKIKKFLENNGYNESERGYVKDRVIVNVRGSDEFCSIEIAALENYF